MSTVDKKVEQIGPGTQIISWESLTAQDDGKPVDVSSAIFKTIQFQGIFNGASIQLEGSIDGKNYHALTDPQGNNLSKKGNGIESIVENVRWVRPMVVGGAPDTNLSAHLLIKFER